MCRNSLCFVIVTLYFLLLPFHLTFSVEFNSKLNYVEQFGCMKSSLIAASSWAKVCKVLMKNQNAAFFYFSFFLFYTAHLALCLHTQVTDGTAQKSSEAGKSTVNNIKSRLHIPTVVCVKTHRLCRLICLFEVVT